jgi:DNA-binding GntR family transcriptional regulator
VRAKDSLEQVRVASQFANVILRNCGNEVIEKLHEGLLARINMLRARSMSVPGRTKQSVAEIEEIHAALRMRDADEARRLARIHVLNACAAAKAAFAP